MGADHRPRHERLAREKWPRDAARALRSREPRLPGDSEELLTLSRHRRARLAAALFAAAAAAATGACSLASFYALPRLPSCPGPIPSTDTLPPGDLVWRDRVRYRGGGVDAGFALIAEKRGDRLVLVGLNAFGARAFSVTQERGQVEADARLGRALEVPPETVLRDWHAARAAGDEAPATLELARPECGYRATFVAESRSALDAAH
jgi:hypothetical protein